MNRQIPGYFFDEAKKKYFKIQPNHAALPGSVYSSDGVKRRRIEDDAAFASAKTKERIKNHIRRARLLADPLLGGSLRQELGLAISPNSLASAYCQQWRGSELLHSEPYDVNQGAVSSLSRGGLYPQVPSYNLMLIGEPAAAQSINSSTISMGGFDFNPQSNSLFAPFMVGALSEMVCKGDTMNFGSEETDKFVQDSGTRYQTPFVREISGLMISISQSPISSININHESRLLLTTWRAPAQGHNVLIGSMMDVQDPYTPGEILSGGPLITYRIENSLGIPSTIWASTSGKPHSPFSFVIASEDGVYSIGKAGFNNAFVRPPKAKQSGRSGVLAVECLSHFPSVILSGARNGIIDILDVRVPETQYQSGHEGIMHPSAVAHIKQIDGNLITVAGLDSTLCNYDLRFTKKQPRASSWPNIRSRRMPERGRKPMNPEYTVPVLVYPEHENDAYIDLGFDIDPEAGIVAAVQHDEANTVKIFSLKTGGFITSLDATGVGASIDTANVKAIRFIQDKERRGMKSLWVSKGTKIVRYAW